jgi:hypothetical protein
MHSMRLIFAAPAQVPGTDVSRCSKIYYPISGEIREDRSVEVGDILSTGKRDASPRATKASAARTSSVIFMCAAAASHDPSFSSAFFAYIPTGTLGDLRGAAHRLRNKMCGPAWDARKKLRLKTRRPGTR